MRHTTAACGVLFGVAAALWVSGASALETVGYLNQPFRPPSRTFELVNTLDYTQGFGMMAPGRGLPQVAGPALGVGVQADYRLQPALSFGTEVHYQEFKYQEQKARGLVFTVGMTYHFRPQLRADPWTRVGAGYRLLWELDRDGQKTEALRHGFELLTVKVGCDIRVYEELAIAAFVGADLDVFVWEDPANGSSFAMSPAQVGTFIHAGLLARFNWIREQAK
jgi:hypothetical protein